MKSCKEMAVVWGISDYIRAQSEYYYVDKTLLIKEFLDRKAFVSLFTRPRRQSSCSDKQLCNMRYFLYMEKSYIKITGCMFRYGISKCKIVVCNKTHV